MVEPLVLFDRNKGRLAGFIRLVEASPHDPAQIGTTVKFAAESATISAKVQSSEAPTKTGRLMRVSEYV
jgi:hypothetical protein